MRTSLNNIAQTEARLFNKQQPGDALLFDARLLLDTDLHIDLSAQKQVYTLIQQYGHRQLKQEIEAVHQQLFTQPEHLSFKQKIARIFLNR
jgi:predicted metal-dependent HD superfamily phosphohydrolase